MLGCPFCGRNVPIGAIVADAERREPFSEKQIELVTDLRRPGSDRD